MKKQEEIREGIAKEFYGLQSEFEPLKPWGELDAETRCHLMFWAGNVVQKLHSQGVVIKVDKELPNGYAFIKTLRNGGWRSESPNGVGYVAVEPLIED